MMNLKVDDKDKCKESGDFDKTLIRKPFDHQELYDFAFGFDR